MSPSERDPSPHLVSDNSKDENFPPGEHPASAPAAGVVVESVGQPDAGIASLPQRVKTLLIGKPRDLTDRRVFKHVSLIAFLAWVGLGADGLSSSCYGPAEAFEHLKEHSYLAIFLALATMFTVF